MMNIELIAVGKLKEDYLKSACAEYSKRIGAFGKIRITEISEARLQTSPSAGEISAALEKEGKTIIEAIPRDSAVIAMCIEGKMLSSEEYSQKLQKFGVEGKSTVTIIIGSSHGLSDAVKERADMRLSMSPMTFPHQLARVMVLEQTYRALSIINNGKYHK